VGAVITDKAQTQKRKRNILTRAQALHKRAVTSGNASVAAAATQMYDRLRVLCADDPKSGGQGEKERDQRAASDIDQCETTLANLEALIVAQV